VVGVDGFEPPTIILLILRLLITDNQILTNYKNVPYGTILARFAGFPPLISVSFL